MSSARSKSETLRSIPSLPWSQRVLRGRNHNWSRSCDRRAETLTVDRMNFTSSWIEECSSLSLLTRASTLAWLKDPPPAGLSC